MTLRLAATGTACSPCRVDGVPDSTDTCSERKHGFPWITLPCYWMPCVKQPACLKLHPVQTSSINHVQKLPWMHSLHSPSTLRQAATVLATSTGTSFLWTTVW